MFSRLVDQLGFGWTVRTIAFVSLVLLVISIFTLESRFPPHSQKGNRVHPLDAVHALKDNAPYRWLVIALFFGFWG
jgi:Na+/melibiose symporter-like transporter